MFFLKLLLTNMYTTMYYLKVIKSK